MIHRVEGYESLKFGGINVLTCSLEGHNYIQYFELCIQKVYPGYATRLTVTCQIELPGPAQVGYDGADTEQGRTR